MIDNDQITALAREYAEELSPDNKINREMIELDCLGFLDRVLNSYCLVEKSKLKAIRFRKVYSADDVRSKFTEECLIDALFPEIAKEVES